VTNSGTSHNPHRRSGRRRAAAVHALLAASLLLGACTGSASAPADTPAATSPPAATPAAAEPEPAGTPGAAEPTGPPDTAELEPAARTGADIQAWTADVEWSFMSPEADEPIRVTFTGGAASDEFMRTYEIGVGVEGDANGDGIVDLAIPVSQLDGNGFLELWYVWLGGEEAARQVEFPIARSARCGDAVHGVADIDGGFRIDETRWLPEDVDRDCASGGTGAQTRDITIAESDGTPFPLQTAPEEAWGGVATAPEWFVGAP